MAEIIAQGTDPASQSRRVLRTRETVVLGRDQSGWRAPTCEVNTTASAADVRSRNRSSAVPVRAAPSSAAKARPQVTPAITPSNVSWRQRRRRSASAQRRAAREQVASRRFTAGAPRPSRSGRTNRRSSRRTPHARTIPYRPVCRRGGGRETRGGAGHTRARHVENPPCPRCSHSRRSTRPLSSSLLT